VNVFFHACSNWAANVAINHSKNILESLKFFSCFFVLRTFVRRMKQLLIFALIYVSFSSCRKNSFYEGGDAKLEFSTDTVFFDTVFTSLGSSTERLVIFNPYSENLVIQELRLAKGKDSKFRLNVDGIAGKSHEGIEIPANDSIFVFVEVTIDPNRSDAPLVESDSILLQTNGNLQDVDLVAWGQDAYYYRPTTLIPGLPVFSRLSSYTEPPYFFGDTVEWFNDKPHVIYGYLLVDTTFTLKIHAGTQVHFYNNSGLWVGPGSALSVRGEKDNEVVFQGSRLEDYFQDRPGQWDRIWINEGGRSVIQHAIIKNGFVGLQCEAWPFNEPLVYAENPVVIQNTVIQNMVGIGLLARDHKIEAENLVIYDCGTHSLAVNGGGTYDFIHCTFANYWSGNRSEPMVLVNNYFTNYLGVETTRDLSHLYFGNSIIFGSKEEELKIDEDESGIFDLTFDHCILRTKQDTSDLANYESVIFNPSSSFGVNPVFTSTFDDDYSLYAESAAVDSGKVNINKLNEDILGTMRDAIPDIGAYEYKP